MALNVGSRFGPYEIVAPLGAGGMGEVYRARDLKLGREVAIKVLPDLFADDPERLARFQREAQVLASLNHPNISGIYGLEEADGIRALVLELVEGPTLADRITQGSIPLPEVLPIARQIADALEAAHDLGIIHRDLKPANIKVRPDGTVKVLDFGLAKAIDDGPGGAGRAGGPGEAGGELGATGSPTITTPAATRMGVILGTAAYMSPEQAKGKPLDKRTDIWAFGCVLYEMLTGKRAFDGEDVSDTLAFIITKEPDWTALPAATPPQIRTLLRRCLEKDRKERVPDIGMARLEIKEAQTTPVPDAVPAAARKPAVLWKAATALLLLTTVAGLAIAYVSRATAPSMTRFLVSPPEKGAFVTGGRPGASGIISPDGRTLTYTARDTAGKVLLWVRPIDSLSAQPLAGTDGAAFPFWSPDSRFIAYFTQSKLLKIAASGGPPQTVCDVPGGRGGAWSRDGVIVFGSLSGTLERVSSAGGQPVALTRATAGQVSPRFPSFLPDARHLLFSTADRSDRTTGIYLTSLDSGESKRLVASSTGGVYAPPGYLLFARQSTLLAQAFNPETVELTGEPFPVAEGVEFDVFGGVLAFSASENGVLVYGIRLGNADLQMVWLDRQGKPIETIGPPGNYYGLDLAPDGARVAVHRHDGPGGDIWVSDGLRGSTSRLTFDASQEHSSPIWSPDGTRVAFGSARSGKFGLYQKLSDGSGNDDLLVQSDVPVVPTSWSPDGRSIVYSTVLPKTQGDLWVLSLSGERKATPLLNTPFDENHGQISPDGKWLAYDSNETGRSEIYARPFPTGAGKWQVSTKGGRFPRWRRDGQELFYMDNVGKLIAATVKASGSAFESRAPTELFDSGYVGADSGGSSFHPFAVLADGQRFLIPRFTSTATEDAHIAVVVNWTAGLKK